MTTILPVAREEIIRVMMTHGVSFTELADYCGLSVQTFHYQVTTAKHFDSDLERLIWKYFAKKGITYNQTGECKMIADQILEHGSLTNQHLAMLTRQVKNAIADEKLTSIERGKILENIEYFKLDFIESIEELKKIIGGGEKISLPVTMEREA